MSTTSMKAATTRHFTAISGFEPAGGGARLGSVAGGAASAPSGSALSPREVEVLRCLARGLSYTQAALVLDVSINTVRSHVRAIYAKLEVCDRVEAVLCGLRSGLVSLDE